jgi:hypothetical protein
MPKKETRLHKKQISKKAVKAIREKRISKKPTPKKAIKTAPRRKQSSVTAKIVIPKLKDNLYNLEIYIQYNNLENDIWVYILKQIETIKKQLINDFKLEYDSRNNNSKIVLTPTLNIEFIHTGKSVIIRYSEGWKPKIRVKGKDLIIEVPVKAALPGLILYTFYVGFDKYLELQGKKLDNELKKIELQQKLKEVGKPVDTLPNSGTAQTFINKIEKTDNIVYLRVNDLVLKDRR